MKILYPIIKGIMSQSFGINPQLYAQFKDSFGNPLQGHNGIDIVSFHGDNILSSVDSLVYKTCDINTGSVTKGFGVYTISEPDENGICYEIVYWHTMSNLQFKIGDKVKQGDVLAYEGDSGFVYLGGVRIPDNELGVPPFRGTHLHWGMRKCVKTKDYAGKRVLGNSDHTPLIDSEGYAYLVINPENGFDGCSDAMKEDIIYYQEFLDSKIQPIIQEVGKVAPTLPQEQQKTLLEALISLLKSILIKCLKNSQIG